ncbi:MAG: hypothetical protein V4568_00530 [Pseudomonadota bacterium]
MFETDQAAGLRRLFARNPLRIVVLAGAGEEKAGVTAHLAAALAEQGEGVMIMDGSHGDVGTVLGLHCRYELGHVITGDKRLTEVLQKSVHGIQLLPAARGLDQLHCLTSQQGRWLRQEFFDLKAPVNTLLINARPQGAAKVLAAFQGRARLLMVVSEAAASITATYGEMKSLNIANGASEFDVLVGAARDAECAAAIYGNIAEVAKRFLSAKLNFRGFIPGDVAFHRLSGVKRPGLARERTSTLAHTFQRIAYEMNQWFPPSGIISGNTTEVLNHAAVC